MGSNSSERRKHHRVPTQILIKYRNADQFFTDYIQNISRGGIFVPTDQPLPETTFLQIAFALPYCDELITTEGIVVRSLHGEAGSGGGPSGMGIQFQALSEENLRLIDAYVESMWQRGDESSGEGPGNP